MPKFKALRKTQKLLGRLENESSSDSDDSELSNEYSHVPVSNLSLNVESLNMNEHHQTQVNHLEILAQQMQTMMQAITDLTAKQTMYESHLNDGASTSRSTNVSNTRTASGDPFRIPDPIKMLPSFNGNKKQLNWWLETAEKTLDNFQPLVSPEIFQIYLTAVSNKIEGHAKDVLCTNGNPSTFKDIKEILIAALGDKQDLSTYNCQLWHNKMDGSISKHYQRTKQLVQSIKALAKQKVKYNDHWDAINEFIDEYCLAAYVSGLQKPYFGYVQAAEPKNIESAYAFLCKFSSNESNRSLTQNPSTQPKFKTEPNFSRKTGHENEHFQQKPHYSNKQNNQNYQPKSENTVEPMDTKSTNSRLTLNRRIIHNNETYKNPDTEDDQQESESESETEIDTNFQLVTSKPQAT